MNRYSSKIDTIVICWIKRSQLPPCPKTGANTSRIGCQHERSKTDREKHFSALAVASVVPKPYAVQFRQHMILDALHRLAKPSPVALTATKRAT